MPTKSNRRSRGQGLVEFAVVIPLFLLMLFSIVDLGRVIWANDVLANAAREGARWASVNSATDILSRTPATKDQIAAYTISNFSWAGGTSIAVAVCYSSVSVSAGSATNCSGSTDQTGATNARGDLVTVTVTSTVPILTGSLLGFGDFGVSGTSTVLINN